MLKGNEYERLQTALLDAFRSYSDLEQLVMFSLNRSLPEIASTTNLRDVVFRLLEWADAQGQMTLLLRGAVERNPGNEMLANAVRDYCPIALTGSGRIHGSLPALSAAFTGREDILLKLHETLHSENAALTPVPAALQGLGGIGKTQTARAYIERHREDYADLFWTVGETPEQLASALAGFYPGLYPAAPPLADQNAALAQVKQWFDTHDNWLLVVDNAENLTKLRPVLPSLHRGRLLLTTRDIVMGGLATRIEIDRLDEENGALLLLRRADPTKPKASLSDFAPQWQADACAISRDVDGLPLALDQAGAYIEARQITPARYRELYAKRRETLHRNYENPDHASVTITFTLALEQVEQIPEYGPAAAQLVTYCAFLAPDAIPEEIFTAGAEAFDEPLRSLASDEASFMDAWASACRYALIRRGADTSTFTMHRLAQEVIREKLTEDERRQTAEHVVIAVHRAFPDASFPTWVRCERLLPHALLCREYIAIHAFHTPATAWLLDRMATCLQERIRYGDAESLFVEALAIRRRVQGEEHEEVAAVLNNLATLYQEMDRAEEAIRLLEQALAIGRRTFGEAHPNYANGLGNLGAAYYCQDRYDKAAMLLRQALDSTRRIYGSKHPDVARCLHNLALVYDAVGRYADAEPLLCEALDMAHQTLDDNHPDYATNLQNLGSLYLKWGRLKEAEPLLQQALTTQEGAHGNAHPDVAYSHFWMGRLRYEQGKQAQAVDEFQRALAIEERVLGPNHPHTINTREWLAKVETELAEALIPNPSPLLEAEAERKMADGEKGDA